MKLAAVLAASMSDTFWTVGGIAFFGSMLWISRSFDPHWVARDGRAFSCQIQPITIHSGERRTEGRWRSVRAVVGHDGKVRFTRRGLRRGPGSQSGEHPVLARAESKRKRTALFVLGGQPNMLIRIPGWSRAVAVLESSAIDTT